MVVQFLVFFPILTSMELQPDLFDWPKNNGNLFERSYPIIDTWGCYQNPWPGWNQPGPMLVLKWHLKHNKRRQDLVIPPKETLDNLLPVLQPNFSEQKNSYTWLGHSTCLFEMDGISVLTDPVFGDSCSPPLFKRFPFISNHFQRLRPMPCQVGDLPQNLRLVLLSHDHYEHLHYESIEALVARYGTSQLTFCVPARMGESSLRPYFPQIKIVELNWWQTARFIKVDGDERFDVICCPNQHWSGRVHMYDTNWSLWAGFAVVGPSRKVYFAGDTGYCPAFTEIGREIGPFDVAAIPIGAYNPTELLSPQHVSPKEALQIHLDINAKKSFAIHWGTYPLGDEPFFEPKDLLEDAVRERNLSPDTFRTTCPGETIRF